MTSASPLWRIPMGSFDYLVRAGSAKKAVKWAKPWARFARFDGELIARPEDEPRVLIEAEA